MSVYFLVLLCLFGTGLWMVGISFFLGSADIDWLGCVLIQVG